MESPEGKKSSNPTDTIFIPKLPPSLSDWKTLRTHFLCFGELVKVVLNPQKRWCTIRFKSVSDAEAAKVSGCIWKNKSFDCYYWTSSSKLSQSVDTRSAISDVFGYSDLEALWSDEDIEDFGVIKSKPKSPILKSEALSLPKPSPKSRKQKVKLYSEKIEKLKDSVKAGVKEKPKEPKKNVKEGLKRRPALKTKMDHHDVSLEREGDANQLKLNLKEKFAILEERDKQIRKSFVKSSNVKSKAVVGTCPDMCPERERIMREYRRLISVFEMIPGTQSMDHALAVKAYVRSSADQEEPLPHDLRPEPVLTMTMSYLINEIMPLIEDTDVNISEWYDFCWDRLRGIRKDIIQQQLCDLETVTIIEQCARFHICCYDRFWGIDPSIFDEKINTENLMNCLQTLRHMYEDLSKENIKCPNEAEFNVYMILLNMKTGDLMATYQQFPEILQKEEQIRAAVKIYLTFNNSMYSQFFKLVRKSTYLDTCLLQRYFYHVRVQALQAIVRAYCPPNKGGSIPLKQMMKILKFDNPEDAKLFCEGHGLSLKENKKDFRLYRSSFFFPESKITFKHSSSLVVQKRLPLIKAVVGDKKYNFRNYKSHKVHCSFTKDGKLSAFASDASDQKFKSSELSDKMQIANEEYAKSEEEFDEMDVDTTEITAFQLQEQDENDFGCIKNESSVSWKQNKVSSAFRFDLKPPVEVKKEPESSSDVVAEPFKFSLGVNLFDNNSSSTSSFRFQLNPSVTDNKSDTVSRNETVTQVPVTRRDHSDSLKNLNSEKKVQKRKRSVDKSISNKVFSDKKSSNSKKELKPVPFSDFQFNFGTKMETGNMFGKSVTSEVVDDIKIAKDSGSRIKSFHKEIKDSKSFISDHVDGAKPDELKSDRSSVGDSEPILFVMKNEKEEVNIEKEECYKKEEENKARLKLEEKRTLLKLRKDLRKRMKAATTSHFIRKWKEKVNKIKRNRKEFPLLMPVPVDQHISVWGTVVNSSSLASHSLLVRLKEKRQNIQLVNSVLDTGISSTVPYLGREIASCIANSRNNNKCKLIFKDFSMPSYWKLVVSIPFLKNNEFFVNKFKSFIKRMFYKSEVSPLGSVVEEITSENVPVYYCVHLVCGNDFRNEKDKIVSASSVLFFIIDGIESCADKYKRLKNLLAADKSSKRVSVAFMRIGKKSDDRFIKTVEEKPLRKINKWVEEYWRDYSSIDCVVKYLIKNVVSSSNIQLYTLDSLFKRMSEHVSDVLNTIKMLSEEFDNALADPNIIISFYNSFFNSLGMTILRSDFKDYDVIPPEFIEYVEYFHRLGESCPCPSDIGFNKSFRPSISKSLAKINLPSLTPWPPLDGHDLLSTLSLFCESLNCSNILPRIVRIVDCNEEDIDFVKFINTRVPWISVIDLIVNNILQLYFDENKRKVIICDTADVNCYYRFDFCFKLLQHIINKI